MIMIVEGSNRVGKSTFIELFRQKCVQAGKKVVIYNKRYIKDNYFELDDFKNTIEGAAERMLAEMNLLCALNEQLPDVVFVLDRFHLSELVYGEVYRKYYNQYMLKIDNMLATQKSLLVMLTSRYKHLGNEWSEEKKEKFVEIQDKMEGYFDFMRSRKCKLLFDRPETAMVLVDNIITRLKLIDNL